MAKTRERNAAALPPLASRLLKARDEERRRLARQLHDTLGQYLAAVQINLSLIKPAAGKLSSRASQALSDSVNLALACAHEVQAISFSLHPPLLEEMGLVAALRAAVEEFTRSSGVKVSLDVRDRIPRLPHEVELNLFRIMQEALAHLHRHSRSSTAVLRIERRPGSLALVLSDRGRGLPPIPRAGVGIPVMRQRTRQVGGQLVIKSGAAGTVVRLIVPLRRGVR